MRLARIAIPTVLVFLALTLAIANVWFAAARSTIPLCLDAVVTSKEVRHEKHPPKDDVCLLGLNPTGMIEIDQSVFDRVEVGNRLVKSQWEPTLESDGMMIDLHWSADARGMLWAMPLVVLITLVTSAAASRIRRVS